MPSNEYTFTGGSESNDLKRWVQDETDLTHDSPFHTLGKGATQAASGNHKHIAADIEDLPSGLSLSDNIPKADSGSGSQGVGTQAARDDHIHPAGPGGLTLGNVVPPADSGSGGVGTSVFAAKADHYHPAHTTTNADNANYAANAGNADTVDGVHASGFATSGHTHAANPPLASTNPAALGSVAVGVGTTAARADHVHPTTGLALSSHTHPTSMTTCSYASGWGGYASPRVAKYGNLVTFTAFFRKLTSALVCTASTNYVLATIPDGYRPVEVVGLPALLIVGTDDGISTGAGASSWVLARISIETSGTVQFMLSPGATISVDQWMMFTASWYTA